jgi:hypothetical protein
MPGMLGTQLLMHASTIIPHGGRILITGSPFLAMAMDAINLGAASRLFIKPFSPTLLLQAIRIEMDRIETAADRPSPRQEPRAEDLRCGTYRRLIGPTTRKRSSGACDARPLSGDARISPLTAFSISHIDWWGRYAMELRHLCPSRYMAIRSPSCFRMSDATNMKPPSAEQMLSLSRSA